VTDHHGFKDHFSQAAARYAQHRPSYPAALVDFLARAAPHRGLAWEAGCGSGQLSVLLGERFARVIATDASREQLTHATLHPNVEYALARAEASGVAAGVADLAVAAQAAHWFDLPAYYAEVRRTGRAGAVVALVTYDLVRIDPDIDCVIDRFYSQTLGSYWPPERRHVEEGYRSLPFPFEPIEAPPLEMRARWALADLVGYVGTWSAVRALVRAQGQAALVAFHQELGRAWGRESTIRAMRWRLALRVGRV
jgi:SAM-dependent methyltransferase